MEGRKGRRKVIGKDGRKDGKKERRKEYRKEGDLGSTLFSHLYL